VVGEPIEQIWLYRTGLYGALGVTYAGTTIEQMYDAHRNVITGPAYLYDQPSDQTKDWSFCLALTAAGINAGLPVNQATLNKLLQRPNPPSAVQDYTTWSATIGSPQNRLDAYDWAKTALLPYAGSEAVFLLRQGTWRLYDYATATRGFVFHLNWHNQPERELAKEILSDPKYVRSTATPLLGYYFDADGGSDGDGFSPMAAESGLYGFGADFFGNASFWSGLPRAVTRPVQPPGFVVVPSGNNLYTSVFVSDGDNFQHNQNFVGDWLGVHQAADLNAGVSINPGLLDFAPSLYQWASDNLTPSQELIGGPNGLGYSYPSLGSNPPFSTTYQRWYADNREYFQEASIRSAQLWKDKVTLPSTSLETIDFLRQNLNVDGVLNGDDAQQFPVAHVYGRQVAANTIRSTTWPISGSCSDPVPSFRACLSGTLSLGTGGFAAIQVAQQGSPANFASDVASLNAQHSNRLIPLAPRDWFASVADRHLRPPDNGELTLVSFATASGGQSLRGETPHLCQTCQNVTAIDNDHRYADLDWTWTYRINLPDTARKLRLELEIAGEYIVTITPSSGAPSQIEPSNGTESRHTRVIELGPGVLPSPSIDIKFQDKTDKTGSGPSLWSLRLVAPAPAPSVPGTYVSSLSSGDGQTGQGANAHRYVDLGAYMTFQVSVDGNRLNFAEIDIQNQFVVEGAATSSGPFKRLASAHMPVRHKVRVDLGPIQLQPGATQAFLRFRDAWPSDGNGASVYSVSTFTEDWRQAAFTGPSGQPEETALLAPAGACNVSSIDVDHRFADQAAAFTYRLTFPAANSGYVLLDIAGDYVVSVAPEVPGFTCDSQAWTEVERPGDFAERHKTAVDVSSALAQSPSKTVFLRFHDRSPYSGNGPSVWSVRALSR
jgi:hypothetical protein